MRWIVVVWRADGQNNAKWVKNCDFALLQSDVKGIFSKKKEGKLKKRVIHDKMEIFLCKINH